MSGSLSTRHGQQRGLGQADRPAADQPRHRSCCTPRGRWRATGQASTDPVGGAAGQRLRPVRRGHTQRRRRLPRAPQDNDRRRAQPRIRDQRAGPVPAVQARPNLPGRLRSGLITGSPGAGPSIPMPRMPSAPTAFNASCCPSETQLSPSPSSPHLPASMSWKGTALLVLRLPNRKVAEATVPDHSVPSRVCTVSRSDHTFTPGQDDAEIALAKMCKPTEPVSSKTGTTWSCPIVTSMIGGGSKAAPYELWSNVRGTVTSVGPGCSTTTISATTSARAVPAIPAAICLRRRLASLKR